MPAPSHVNRNVPAGFDAWFARACSRDPAKRFQTPAELAHALAGVCGLERVRMATLDEDQIQYVMRAPAGVAMGDSLRVPPAMSPRVALLAGLVLGIAMMVAVLAFVAWRDRPPAAGGTAPPSVSDGR